MLSRKKAVMAEAGPPEDPALLFLRRRQGRNRALLSALLGLAVLLFAISMSRIAQQGV